MSEAENVQLDVASNAEDDTPEIHMGELLPEVSEEAEGDA